jgi:hypothetical protein
MRRTYACEKRGSQSQCTPLVSSRPMHVFQDRVCSRIQSRRHCLAEGKSIVVMCRQSSGFFIVTLPLFFIRLIISSSLFRPDSRLESTVRPCIILQIDIWRDAQVEERLLLRPPQERIFFRINAHNNVLTKMMILYAYIR